MTFLLDVRRPRAAGSYELVPRHRCDLPTHLLEKLGWRMPLEGGYIAATAKRHGLTIVTGNDQDFRRPGMKVFNPFKELA
jgi:hypothetical protein